MLCQFDEKIKEINCKDLLKTIQESPNILQGKSKQALVSFFALFYLNLK